MANHTEKCHWAEDKKKDREKKRKKNTSKVSLTKVMMEFKDKIEDLKLFQFFLLRKIWKSFDGTKIKIIQQYLEDWEGVPHFKQSLNESNFPDGSRKIDAKNFTKVGWKFRNISF